MPTLPETSPACTTRRASVGSRRWPLLVCLCVAIFAVWHAVAMDRYLARVTAERFVGSGEVGLPREQILLGTAFDGQTWLRLSEQLTEREGWRLRASIDDNAPEGRAVYWSSGWAWWLIGGGWLWGQATGGELEGGLARMGVWANLPALLLVLAGLGWWCARRRGLGAAAVLIAALAGHRGFYAGFYPGNPDHHGVIAACAAGLVLGVSLAGAGWYRREGGESTSRGGGLPTSEAQVRAGLIGSAVCGAVGLWFSAASLIPVLVVLAAGVILAGRPGVAGAEFSSAAWRAWGRWGGGLSLGFYLVEQFPDRLGWRLEVNHPVYALAWLGGAELLAWWLERGRDAPVGGAAGARWLRPALAGLAVALPALVVAARGQEVFALVDPLLAGVHSTVTELASLPARIAVSGWGHFAGYAVIQPALLLLAAVAAWCWRREDAGHGLRVVGVAVILLTVLGWWQNRWMLIAAGPWAVLLALAWSRWSAVGGRWRGVVAVALVALAAGWHPLQLVRERLAVQRVGDVQTEEARQLLFREVARSLAADAAGERVLLLAGLEASTSVSFYGDFGSIGTLYWENHDGMMAAARMLGAADEAEMARALRLRGVTHVALFGFDGGGAMYWADQADAGRPMGPRLLHGESEPDWLRPIPYLVPPQFGRIESRVRLFAVDFAQRPAEAAYLHGLAAVAHGEVERALRAFERAGRAAPDMPAPWLRLAELRLSLGRAPEALVAMIAGLKTLPVEQRENAFLDAARLFNARGATAEADQLLDLAVAAGGL